MTVLFTVFSTCFLGDFFRLEIVFTHEIHQKPIFLTENIPNDVENHVPLPFYWVLISRWGFYNVKIFGAMASAFRRSLTLLTVMTGTRRQNGAIKCMQFPMQKLIFWDSGSVPLFVGRILVGLLVNQRAMYVLCIGLYSFWRNRPKTMCWTPWIKQ